MADQPEPFDVVIIGGGPGGYAAALYGAGLGLNIAMVEMANACDGKLTRKPSIDLLDAISAHDLI